MKLDAETARLLDLVPEQVRRRIDAAAARGCWLWLGALDERGEAFVMLDGVSPEHVARLVFRWAEGNAPAHHRLVPTCRVPSCVNPAHRIAVPNGEATHGWGA